MSQGIFSDSKDLESPSEFPAILTIAEVPALLRLKEDELLQRHAEALNLFDAPHTSADTEKLEAETRKTERDLIILRRVLNDDVGLSNSDLNQIKVLTAKCDGLMRGAHELSQRLIEDKHNLEQKEGKDTFDLFKVFGYALVIPYAAYNIMKIYITNPDVDKATPVVIAGAGLSFHFRKNIKAAWTEASKNVTPRKIADALKAPLERSFTLYYLRETGTQRLAQAKAALTQRSIASRKSNAVIGNPKGPDDLTP